MIFDYDTPKLIDPKKLAMREYLARAGVSGDVPIAAARLQIGRRIEAANDNVKLELAA